MRKILIVGGGYAGFYAAWKLEKKLHPGEAKVTIIDPRPYMTYQPFLPEVMAGSIEPRHAVVPLRRHLKQTDVVAGTVRAVDHASKEVTVGLPVGGEAKISYDIIVVTAGAVTRRYPIPGIADVAIGLKHIEEAIAVRNRLLSAFDQASNLPRGPKRDRLLTIAVVGGGFAGVEGFGELLSLATALLPLYPKLTFEDLDFHLVETQRRILPEVSEVLASKVMRSLERRGAHIHLNTRVVSAASGHIVLSNGNEFDSNLIIWTAGNAANPILAKHTDFPVDERGYLLVRADLRLGTSEMHVADAWAAGDNAAIKDLSVRTPNARTVPNAQHAVRQGKLLSRNIVASLRGRPLKNYIHKNLGVVATLGIGHGVFQSGRIAFTGLPAWLVHRGYHVLAIPTWERKIRVAMVWMAALIFGRDIASLESEEHPRQAFITGGEPEIPSNQIFADAWSSGGRNARLPAETVPCTGGAQAAG